MKYKNTEEALKNYIELRKSFRLGKLTQTTEDALMNVDGGEHHAVPIGFFVSLDEIMFLEELLDSFISDVKQLEKPIHVVLWIKSHTPGSPSINKLAEMTGVANKTAYRVVNRLDAKFDTYLEIRGRLE